MDIEKTARNGLEILSYSGENYKPLVAFKTWRVATLNHGPRFEKATYLERHRDNTRHKLPDCGE